MQDLRISLLQSKLEWENPAANRDHFSVLLDGIAETDLILLPEMFSTGFTMNSAGLAETMDGETLQWMQAQAEKKNAVICGSLIIQEEKKFFNRLIWMRPDASFETYDKRHLFRMANENEHFSPGSSKLVVELKGWKICPLVCYDLRFPVWSRNIAETDRMSYANWEYDLLVYIANWPEPRIKAWEKLLYARAIENQCYVAAVNRIGEDGKGIDYSGSSMAIDAKGELLWKAEDNKAEIKTLKFSKSELEAFRKKFPLGMDGDEFEMRNLK